MILPMNRSQFEELRRWGNALRRDEREDLRAAGEGIRRLCLEIDRLERELAVALTASAEPVEEPAEPEAVEAHEDTLSDEPHLIEASLRQRLSRRLGLQPR